jgi:hypothetical protein
VSLESEPPPPKACKLVAKQVKNGSCSTAIIGSCGSFWE